MRNFASVKHRQKMSGFPMKSIFMFRIKGGMKKGEGILSQNCFESVKVKDFAFGV